MTEQERDGPRSASPLLLTPTTIRDLTLRNRIVVAPMCMYSSGRDGLATDFHFAHLGRFALGGAGLVIAEATAVSAVGRITYTDLGLYDDSQIAPLRRLVSFVKSCGAAAGIQLNHSGRKGSTRPPWERPGTLDQEDTKLGNLPWPVSGPSAIAATGRVIPAEMDQRAIDRVLDEWRMATARASAAGFDVIEIHGGHGYLVHQFLSPLSNHRTDAYGGDLAGRMRFALEIVGAVRSAWPAGRPLFFRVSSLDGPDGGWTLEDTVCLARSLKERGVDVVDCSAGGIQGLTATNVVPPRMGFQVPFAARVRREVSMLSMAVGLIVDPVHAEAILQAGDADLIAVAREFLSNPNWANDAHVALTGEYGLWPLPFRSWLERRARLVRQMPDHDPAATNNRSPP